MRTLFVALGLTFGVTVGATAQTPAPAPLRAADYAGEIVVTRAGAPVAPWRSAKTCQTGPEKIEVCRPVLYNPTTREIARIATQLSSRFEATGDGLEVRRSEAAIDAATRLAGLAVAK